MKKTLRSCTAAALIGAMMLTGCAANNTSSQALQNSTAGGDQVLELEFWSAPQVSQQAFWSSMAEQYAQVNPNVRVVVSAMPESPSSEAGIQSAIASGTAPDMSENVFRGFAAQLAENKAIVPFDSFEGLDEVIESRGMSQIMENWKSSDGQQYVLPVFSNPSMFLWRIDILKELGFDKAPATYSEVYAVGEALKKAEPEKFVWASDAFTNTSWYKRWWDFLTLYDAASNGNQFISDNKLIADDAAGTAVFEFFSEMKKNDYLLAQESTDPFETGLSLARQFVPIHFLAMREKYPDLKYGENFVVANAPVPDGVATENVKTMADSKGVVIYAQSSPEEQQASWEFLKWVFMDGAHDVEWMETTNLLPAQDDLLANEDFNEIFEKSPELIPFAENAKNAVPAIDNPLYVETHTAMGEQGMVPVLNQSLTGEEAWTAVKTEIESLLTQ